MRAYFFSTYLTQLLKSITGSYLAHGPIWELLDDVRVLLTLEFVEELGSQHDVEVLAEPRRHLLNGALAAAGRRPFAGTRFVLNVVLKWPNMNCKGLF